MPFKWLAKSIDKHPQRYKLIAQILAATFILLFLFVEVILPIMGHVDSTPASEQARPFMNR